MSNESQSDEPKSDFIRDMIREDLESGKHSSVVTRFPPEPNGYLHIGHSKAICLNFGIAEELGGRCHLRFDDTNPATEDPEYVESIQRDIRWLGFDWGEHLYFASDYFERLYRYAVLLIRKGKAYVDSADEETIREYRGTVTEPGRPTPDRDRTVEESLDLFERMRRGELEDGSHVLRAKIDLASNNMLMRDPILYRIRHAPHYRQGDEWCIYPLYDFAHCLEDAIEHVTHSLCSLEFENNRELYDWVIRETEIEEPVPEQTEFARLNLGFTVMSKRKLLRLVREGHVAGWDDPRMPTLSGYRRRGYTPEAIREFCDRVGVTRNYNVIDAGLLEYAIRDDLNTRAPRRMAVLDPLELVIENYPEGKTENLEAQDWPRDVPKDGSRSVPFGRRLWVEREDFAEDPPAGWHRLAPGREVRLRYAYLVTLREVVKDDDGHVVQLRATYDPETRGGDAPDGRKVRGTLHWVSAEHAADAEVRLYDRLFRVERPDAEGEDFIDNLNPESLRVVTAKVEPGLAETEAGSHFQFERQGYFFVDPQDSKPGGPVFSRTVTLRDTWAKTTGDDDSKARAARRAAERERHKARQREISAQTTEPDLTPREEAAAEALESEGVSPQDARVLVRRPDLRAFFDEIVEHGATPRAASNWLVNELSGLLGEREVGDLVFGGAEVAELLQLLADDEITSSAAKEVLGEMVEDGGTPREIVERRGLAKVAVDDLGSLIDRMLEENAAEVEEYRAGKKALIGFFVGQVMRATSGAADAKSVRRVLEAKLGG